MNLYWKGKGTFLIVLECFWGKKKCTFIPLIVKSVDQNIYHRLKNRIQNTLGNPIPQHDNAPIYTGKMTIKLSRSQSYRACLEALEKNATNNIP